jgi:hypothetical protein
MCMVDGADEMVEVLSDRWHTARKEHACRECRRMIQPGERYNVHAFRFDGAFSSHRTCEHCTVARTWLSGECGGWVYGEVEEDMREHATSGYYPLAVARLAVGMRRDWTTVKGGRMPVPPLPKTTHEAKP